MCHAQVAVIFQVGVSLLLVNMLIAQMAKTFDAVWESQDLNFMYLRARTNLPALQSKGEGTGWPAAAVSNGGGLADGMVTVPDQP